MFRNAIPLLFVSIFALIAAIILQINKGEAVETEAKLRVGEKIIEIEIADTEDEITKGLSGREKLADNQGLYFVLGSKREATFWMKDMKFSIDIIWIDEGKIVGIEENAPLPSGGKTPTFNSPVAITHVLEVNAGFSKENNLNIGNIVELVR